MRTLRVIRSILVKEREDIVRNKKMLMIMFLFPVMYWIMSQAAGDIFTGDGSAFILMYIIMVPIMLMASIVAEEKEKSTLKLLILSGVKTLEYIIGVIIVIMMFIILGILFFDFQGAFRADATLQDAIIILLCAGCSMMIGSIIGVTVPNQMTVGSVAIPIILVIFFIPVLANFEPKYYFIAKFFYSSVVFDVLKGGQITAEKVGILALNLIIVLTLFALLFSRRRILQDINKK